MHEIASVTVTTQPNYFRDGLDRGMTEANTRVAQSLFTMATTGGNVADIIERLAIGSPDEWGMFNAQL